MPKTLVKTFSDDRSVSAGVLNDESLKPLTESDVIEAEISRLRSSLRERRLSSRAAAGYGFAGGAASASFGFFCVAAGLPALSGSVIVGAGVGGSLLRANQRAKGRVKPFVAAAVGVVAGVAAPFVMFYALSTQHSGQPAEPAAQPEPKGRTYSPYRSGPAFSEPAAALADLGAHYNLSYTTRLSPSTLLDSVG